jgi:hypothetical protein
MLEGGGKTPILSPLELEEIGYKIIAYPLSLIGVSMRAMEVSCLYFVHASSTCVIFAHQLKRDKMPENQLTCYLFYH